MSTTAQDHCELCAEDGGEVLFRSADLRVVLVDDAAYPGFCRVIWREHVKEMTLLPSARRAVLMDAVWRVEAAMLEALQPAKINLASLGNMTQHLHWHLIPRFKDDAHFPNPIWGAAQRVPTPEVMAARRALLPSLRAAIIRHLTA